MPLKDEMVLSDRINLLEQELKTLAEKASNYKRVSEELEELRLDMKALKLFLTRHYPEIKSEVPEIRKKLGR